MELLILSNLTQKSVINYQLTTNLRDPTNFTAPNQGDNPPNPPPTLTHTTDPRQASLIANQPLRVGMEVFPSTQRNHNSTRGSPRQDRSRTRI